MRIVCWRTNHFAHTCLGAGTREYMQAQQSSGAPLDVSSLIGQFGVGFYSSFIVAKRVRVYSRKDGEAQGYVWESDGSGEFTISPADGVERGTRIEILLTDEHRDFADPMVVHGASLSLWRRKPHSTARRLD